MLSIQKLLNFLGDEANGYRRCYKKYRKEAGMTQEEMANRLGVTTPAVNKWENSNSKPDIELLAPIARLLDISLDTLLSFHEKLSDTEIEEIIRKMDRMFSEEGYEKTYEWALRLIKEYPNCNMLIWQTAVMLDARRITDKCTNQEKYDKQINAWYELALHDENEEIQHHAADSLFGFYLRKKDYTKAEKYLDYFSEYDPMKSYYQGRLLQKQGKIKEAYEKYENIIFPALVHLILFFPQWRDWHCGKMISVMRDFCQGRYRQLHIHWKWENIMSIRQCLILYVQGKM